MISFQLIMKERRRTALEAPRLLARSPSLSFVTIHLFTFHQSIPLPVPSTWN